MDDAIRQRVKECAFWWSQDCWIQSEPEMDFEFSGQLVEAETHDGSVWGNVFYLHSFRAPRDCDPSRFSSSLIFALERHLHNNTEADEIRIVLLDVGDKDVDWTRMGYSPLKDGWRKTLGEQALPLDLRVPYLG